MIKTELYLNKDCIGKKIYRIIQRHNLVIEQEILASSEDEAFDLYLKNGGLNYSKMTSDLTNTSSEIETTLIDAESPNTRTEYVGTVVQSKDDIDEVEVDDAGGII